jgi:ABC-type dipeptide/oligopeptide/nickel transport system permease component
MRLGLMSFVLVGVSLIVFYLGRGLLPPESALAPYITPRMNDGVKLALARSLGVATSSCPSWIALANHLSACLVPVWEQYFSWLSNVLSGNWGYSLLPGISGTQTTWYVFWSRFSYTAELAIGGTIVTALVAIPLGIISATHNNRLPDHISRFISLGGYSVPVFWFGFFLSSTSSSTSESAGPLFSPAMGYLTRPAPSASARLGW